MADASKPKLRLHWWDAPGRGAEPTRLALALKGVEFEDVRYAFADKAAAEAARARSPYGQFPYLEVDGRIIAQSNTIMRYVGRLCGLLPDDPVDAARAEAVLDFVAMDVEPAALCNHLEGEEKLEARRAAAAPGSQLHKRFAQLDAAIGPMDASKGVDMAHLKVFCETSTIISGFYDGFPADEALFEPYNNIQALRKDIANLPEVKAYYAGRDGFYKAFSQLAST